MPKVGFIGVGNMATAIITGISNSKLNVDMLGYDVDATKLEPLIKLSITPVIEIESLCNISDYLFLSVKPQSFTDVLNTIRPFVKKTTIIISIAAGITAEFICEKLDFDAKIVRVMPNTPLMILSGATALSATSNVPDKAFKFVQEIFNCAGISRIVPADKMNEIIAINGSSPAFIYEFARCFIEYGKGVGLDEADCLALFSQTLIGSAYMMTSSGKTIDELIIMVSSKGGTTIAGLESFKYDNLEQIVYNACDKCVKRAYELEKELTLH